MFNVERKNEQQISGAHRLNTQGRRGKEGGTIKAQAGDTRGQEDSKMTEVSILS